MPESYRCVVLPPGTGTASIWLHPMLDAWGQSAGVRLEPGTLNLCSDLQPELPSDYITLKEVAYLAPRNGSTLDPRLYPVVLADRQPAWLFRWSDQSSIDDWVGDADGCPRRNRWEVVAEVHLKTVLALAPGDVVEVHFG